MSDPSILPIRPDLRAFFTHCEGLLSKVLQPDHAPFSQDELQMICYYVNELTKIADAQRLHSNGKPAMR